MTRKIDQYAYAMDIRNCFLPSQAHRKYSRNIWGRNGSCVATWRSPKEISTEVLFHHRIPKFTISKSQYFLWSDIDMLWAHISNQHMYIDNFVDELSNLVNNVFFLSWGYHIYCFINSCYIDCLYIDAFIWHGNYVSFYLFCDWWCTVHMLFVLSLLSCTK